MAEEELFNNLEGRELQTMEIALIASVARAELNIEEFIALRISQGANAEVLRDTLLTDLNEGGRIFGEFRRAIKSTAKGAVNRIRDVGEYSEFGIIENYRWSAVLVNTCKDCLGNHAQVKTWEEWQESRFGLPRSGGTRCRSSCKCVLLPADLTELEPIKRAKK